MCFTMVLKGDVINKRFGPSDVKPDPSICKPLRRQYDEQSSRLSWAVLLGSGINMLLILIGSAIVPYPMARILRMQRR